MTHYFWIDDNFNFFERFQQNRDTRPLQVLALHCNPCPSLGLDRGEGKGILVIAINYASLLSQIKFTARLYEWNHL